MLAQGLTLSNYIGMPVRNIYKDYIPESYYHIYNRGLNKANIFIDEQDYLVFLSMLKRYLGKEAVRRSDHTLQPNYHQQLELLAFCLMPNHYHLFTYQHTGDAMMSFMKSLGVAYGMYFNKRYKRSGPIFQQRYKAVLIANDAQLLHISRYIHMNPSNYQIYEWSSLPYYLGRRQANWVRSEKILGLFEDVDYMTFLSEYKDRREELKALKAELADA